MALLLLEEMREYEMVNHYYPDKYKYNLCYWHIRNQ